MAINQLEHPKAGDLSAVMHTTMGLSLIHI